jgi:hypothetical protein
VLLGEDGKGVDEFFSFECGGGRVEAEDVGGVFEFEDGNGTQTSVPGGFEETTGDFAKTDESLGLDECHEIIESGLAGLLF